MIRQKYEHVAAWHLTLCSGVFRHFIGMESFGELRLLADPHAVTKWFVLYQMDRYVIFQYLNNTDCYICNNVQYCIAEIKNKLVWPE